jgi:hypothetical protein
VTKVGSAETVITSRKSNDPLSVGAAHVIVGNDSLQREDTRNSPDVVLTQGRTIACTGPSRVLSESTELANDGVSRWKEIPKDKQLGGAPAGVY